MTTATATITAAAETAPCARCGALVAVPDYRPAWIYDGLCMDCAAPDDHIVERVETGYYGICLVSAPEARTMMHLGHAQFRCACGTYRMLHQPDRLVKLPPPPPPFDAEAAKDAARRRGRYLATCLRCLAPTHCIPSSTGRCLPCQNDARDAGQGHIHESQLQAAAS